MITHLFKKIIGEDKKISSYTNIRMTNPVFKKPDALQMLHLVNSVRATNKLNQLYWNENLYKVASTYSYYMFKENFFSHTDRQGFNHMDRISAIIPQRSFCTAGENLAINESIQKAHIALCKSKGHFQNIINPNYYACGIGVFSPNPNYVWITQLFLG